MEPVVTDMAERRRFEIACGAGVVGFMSYRRRPGAIALLHTEIASTHDGRGLGTLLVRTVLDNARAQGLAVLPYCPFVRGFIDRHPEYLDLVPEERRSAFDLGGQLTSSADLGGQRGLSRG